MADAWVGLAESIEALRADLVAAVSAGAGQSMRFELEPIELTLELAVTKDVQGKVGWKVLEVGGSRESVVTQTLTLRLRPWWERPDGTVTDQFLIADGGVVGQHFGPRDTQTQSSGAGTSTAAAGDGPGGR